MSVYNFQILSLMALIDYKSRSELILIVCGWMIEGIKKIDRSIDGSINQAIASDRLISYRQFDWFAYLFYGELFAQVVQISLPVAAAYHLLLHFPSANLIIVQKILRNIVYIWLLLFYFILAKTIRASHLRNLIVAK